MINKISAVVLCFLLLSSGLLVVASGNESSGEEDIGKMPSEEELDDEDGGERVEESNDENKDTDTKVENSETSIDEEESSDEDIDEQVGSSDNLNDDQESPNSVGNSEKSKEEEKEPLKESDNPQGKDERNDIQDFESNKINEEDRRNLDTSEAGLQRYNRKDNKDRNKDDTDVPTRTERKVKQQEEPDSTPTPTGPSLQATGNYEIDDDFEDDTVGTDPDGWTNSTDTTDIEVSVSDNYAYSGSNSVMLRDDDSTQDSDYPYMYQNHESLTHAVYNFNILQTNLEESQFYAREDDDGTINTGVLLDWYDGNLSYHDGGSWHNVDNYTTNTWYNIRVVADTGSETFDLYVDGQLVVDGGGFYESCTNLDFPIFLGLDFSTPTFYVDDVQVRSGRGYWVGKTSSEWSTGSNWGDGSEPGTSDNVIIPDNCPNYPIVDEDEYANYLDLEKGGYLDVVSSNLYVYEKMNVTGTANMTGGYLRVNYGGTQTTGFEIYDGGYVDVDGGNLYVYYDGGFDSNSGFADLEINSGGELDVSEDISDSLVKVQDDIWIDGTVTMSAGTIMTVHQTSAYVEFRSGSTEDISGGNIECSYRFESNGDFTPTGGKVVMRDTGAPSIGYVDVASGDEFHTLQISKENTEVEIDDYSSEIKATNLYVEDWTNTNGVTSYFDLNGGNVTTNYLRVGNNSVTYGDGQINMSKSYVDIDVNGNVDWEAEGIDDISSGDIYCSGDFSISSNAVFTPTGGNVIMDGSSGATITNDAGGNGKFYNLTVAKSSGIYLDAVNDCTVDNLLKVSNGIFRLDDEEYLVQGSSVITSTIIENGGELRVTGGYFDMPDGNEDVEIQSGGRMYSSAGMVNITDDLNIYGTLDIDGGKVQNSYNSGGYGDFYFYDGSSGTMTGGTLRVFDWIEWNTDTSWEMTGGTLLMSGDNDDVTVKMDDSSVSLYNFEVDDFGTGVRAYSSTSSYPFDINGDVIIQSNGEWDTSLDDNDMYVAGNWDNDNGGTFISGSNTVYLDGGSSTVYTGGTTDGKDFNNLTVAASGATKTLSGNAIDIDGYFKISAGSFDAGGNDMYVAGDWDNNNGGSFISGSNTVYLDNRSSTIYTGGTGSGNDFNHLTVMASGSTKILSGNAIDIDGNFQISAGTFDPNSYDMTVGGYWDDSGGTFTQASGRVTLYGSGAVKTGTGNNFNELEVSGTYSVDTNSDKISINGLFLITSSGDFTAGSGKTIDFSDNNSGNAAVDVDGTLTLNGDVGNEVSILGGSSNRVNWDISGTIDGNNYTITYPDSEGVQFSGTPNVASLENGSFDYPASGGALLNLSGVGSVPSPIYGCTFENTSDVTPAYNVRADSSTQDVQFRDYSGTLASTANIGESNDDDPSDRIHWGCRVVVTAPLDQTETEPGTYTYNFDVKNKDSNSDTYDLTVDSSNADWTVNAPSSVTVAAGATETVSVDVTIPQDAADNEFSDITLNASSRNGPQTDEDLMKVIYDHTGSDVIVTGPADQTETAPGTYTYDFDVENNGSADDTYDLDPRSSNTDWTVNSPATVTVAAGTTETVSVDVTIPQDALDGESSDITLNATSQNGTQTDEDVMRVTYDHTGSDVIVTAPSDQTETAPGTHTYNFEVENNGSADDTYDLTATSSNTDWTVSAPATVTVTAGVIETVSVDVTIPQDAADGDFSDITLNATSQNGTQTDEDVMRVTYDHTGSEVIVTAPGDATETSPGTYTYNFDVENNGSADDTYDLTATSSNADWTVSALADVTVVAGTTATVSVDVTIPQDALDGEYSDITLNATSQNGTQTDEDLMRVNYDHTGSEVIVTAPGDATQTSPGTYTYNFDVENNGSADDTYDLTAISSNTDWTVSAPATVTVTAGATETVAVDVTIPQDALDGEYSDITLNATSQNGTQTDEDLMRVNYDHTGSEVIVTAPGDTTETAPGTHTYNFEVENNGSADDTYDLTATSSNTDWMVSAPANVTVAVGTTETVAVNVTIPQDSGDGDYSDITLNASSENGTQSDEDTMRVTYDHTGSEVIVTAPGDQIETEPGTYTYNFEVENNGSADDTYDLTATSSNADWTVSAPGQVTVAAGTAETVAVDVTIPQDVADGEYSDITLNATSQNGTQTDEDLMRVTFEHTGSEVIVTAPGDTTETDPGTYTYNFDVKNNGTLNDTYDLTPTSSNADWIVSAPANVTVAAGTTETVAVDVTIPQDALDGEYSDITLNATSQNGTKADEDGMRVTYDHTGSEVIVTAPSDQTETAPGTHTYNFEVENNGSADDTYDLTAISSNTDWTVSAPATVTVTAGATVTVAVDVTIPKDALDGELSDITLNATSQNGTQTDEDVMRITYDHTGSEVIVTAPGDTTETAPGTHTYNFDVENNGSADDTYDLTVDSSNLDWTVSAPANVTVVAGTIETVSVDVTIPEDALDGELSDITLNATSQNGTQTDEDVMRVTYGHTGSDVIVTAPSDQTETVPGTYTYNFDVENNGSADDTYNLTVDSSNMDWTVSAPGQVTVAAGTTEIVSVDVTIPQDALDGEFSDITLNASSANGTQTDEDVMRVTYNHTGSEVIVTAPGDTTETAPGTYTYNFEVENNGSADDTYDLTVDSSNTDWTVSAPGQVTVAAGTIETVAVDVTIPQDAMDGEFSDITLNASSANGTLADEDVMSVTYDHTGSDVIVTAPGDTTETAPGTYTYNFDVENNGSADDTYDLTVDSSNTDWTVSAPANVTVATGTTATVSVDVMIPQDALDGEFSDITLNATSQNATQSDEDVMSVTYDHTGSDVIVTAPSDQTETAPGTHTYNFDVENNGSADDTYDLTLDSSNVDWTVSAPTTVTVGAGATVTVAVDVTIPEGALDGEFSDITLNASSENGTQSDEDTMRVTYDHTGSEVIVTAPGDQIEIEPGTYTYNFDVENNGSADDTYDLTTTSSDADWTVSAPTTVTVGAGATVTVAVDLTIPEDALDGEFSDITLNATSQNGTQADEDVMRVTYDHTGSEVIVTAPGDTTETAPGTYTYNFDVENNGSADDTYDLTATSSNTDWTVSAPANVTIAVGTIQTISVDVTIPQDALDGELSDITLNATSQNGTQTDEDVMRVTYDHLGSDVIVTAPSDRTETDPGTHTYDFDVENNGSADDTYDLTVDSSNADWTVSAPATVTVTAGVIETVSVEVTIPQDALEGEFSDITLNASSQNGTQTDEDVMRVTYDHTGSEVIVTAPANTTEPSPGTYTYDFDVENNDSADDTYDLTAISSNENWTISAPSNVTVAAGKIEAVSVEVTIPQDAADGNSSYITLNATSQNNTSVSDSDDMKVTYIDDLDVAVTAPGDKIEKYTGNFTYQFVVNNTGGVEDTYNLTADADQAGWNATSQLSEITLNSGENMTVDVNVTIPQNAEYGDYSDITLTATSQNNSAVTDSDVMRVTYEPMLGVNVTAPSNQTETSPGNHTYSFNIGNTGDDEDTYDLTVYSSNTDWTVSAPAAVTIGSGDNVTVGVEVTIPKDAMDGEYSYINLTATSQNKTNVNDSDEMRVDYDHQGSDVIVKASGDTTETAPGTYTYNFDVENNGSADDTYDLTIDSSNTDWTVSAPGQVTVAAGTIETVAVDVTIPQDAMDGEFSDITLNASSANGTLADEDTMRVTYDHTGSEVIVTAPGDQIETEPGTYTYDFDVENNGSADDTYDLTVSSSNTDWTVSAPGQVSVAAGTMETVSVEVTIPQDELDGEFSDITLNTSSQNGTQENEDSMRVTYDHTGSEVIVTAPGDQIETEPGTYTYDFDVENNGSADDTYDLTVSSSNTDWTVSAPGQVTVAAGTTETVSVDVTIPEDALDGEFSDITLNATSQNGTQADEDTMRVNYEHTGSEVIVTAPGDQTETDPGTYTYNFDVKNNGSADDTYELTVTSSNLDWTVSAPGQVSVAAGTTETVSVDVMIPQDALDGEFSDITLNATSQNGTQADEDTMRVNYDHTGSEVIVTAPGDQTETDPGTYTYNFDVENNGSADDTYDLTVSSSNTGWTVSAPGQVSVAAGTMETVSVEVTIPQDALDGEFSDINLNASSENGTQTDEDVMRVTYDHTGSEVIVTAPEDTTEPAPGNYTYNFDVKNNGSADDTYDLTVTSSNSNWTVSAPANVTVPAGTTDTVTVEVTIPQGSADGESTNITLTATSYNNTAVNDSDVMMLTYIEDIDVTVTAPSDKVENSTGTFTYQYTVNNTGGVEDTYLLTAEADEAGWNATSQLLEITLSPGEEGIVNVNVTIPQEAEYGDFSDIILTATSQNNSEVTHSDKMRVTYEPSLGVDVTSPADQTENDPGTYTYNFDIENTGDDNDTYNLVVESSNANWTVTAPAAVTVAIGNVKTVLVNVTIPENASVGEYSYINLTATSQNKTNVKDSGEMRVTHEHTGSEVIVTAPGDQTETDPGTYTYNFDVENNGSADDTYDLTVISSNTDWTVSAPGQVSVAAGTTETVSVDVMIPQDALDGEFSDITLNATSQNGTQADEDTMRVNYDHTGSEVIVTAPGDQTETDPGTYTYNFDVENNGSADDTYDLTVSSSNTDWTVSAPGQVSVAAGTTETVSVDITIPQDAADGEFSDITLNATSQNGTQADEETMQVSYEHLGSDVVVRAPGDTIELAPGTYTYNFEVENVGNADDTYDLTVESSNVDWSVTAPNQVTVVAGEMEIVVVEVIIPEGVNEGDQSDIILNATSQNGTHTSEDMMTITYEEYTLTIENPDHGKVYVESVEVTEPEQSFAYPSGYEVEIEVIADQNYQFLEWIGDNETIEDPISNLTTITMEGDFTITAEIVAYTNELTVSSSTGGEVINPGEGAFEYDSGKIVELEAVPDEGYHFVGWTGDNGTIEDPEANATAIEMLGDYEITAEFSIDVYSLSINVEGGGSTSPEEGNHTYEYGEEVTLQAVAEDGWVFSRWSGDVSGEDEEESEINILVDSDKEITAHFLQEADFEVELLSPDEGSEYYEGDEVIVEYTVTNLGEVETTQTIEFSVYDEDSELVFQDEENVTLGGGELVAEEVYEGEFVWDIEEGQVGEFNLVVSSRDDEDENKVTVSGESIEYELTIEKEGKGSTEPSAGTYTYQEGKEVEVTATPAEGWEFVEWTGDETGTEPAIDVAMNENKSLTAHFEKIDISIEITSPGEGELFAGSDITVEWESANANYHEVSLNEEEWIDVGESTTYTFEDVNSGYHTIEVRAMLAEDIFALDSLNITVDTEPPELELISPESGEEITRSNVTIEWTASDDISGIDHFEVRLEGGEWVRVDETEYGFEDLEEGNHTVMVRAIDNAGNPSEIESEFTVTIEEGPSSFFEGLQAIWLILLLIPIFLIAFLLFWRRREEEEEEKEALLLKSKADKGEEAESEWASEESLDSEEKAALEELEEESELGEEELEGEEEPTEIDEKELEAELDEELKMEEEEVEAAGSAGAVSAAAAASEEEEESLRECPECGEKVSKEKEFCPECGAELKEEEEIGPVDDEIFVECDECGFLLTDEGLDECPYCGAPIEKDTSGEEE